MRIIRFSDGNNPKYGVLEEGSECITVLRGDPLFDKVEPSGEIFDLGEVRLLSPVIPRSKVVCVGKNYAEHIAEFDGQTPEEPVLFIKPNTAVIGPDDPIVLPAWSTHVDHEAELAIVVKTLAKDIPVEQVNDIILGYTVANDVTARDKQIQDGQWTRAKAFDTSCPLGPWIRVGDDFNPNEVRVRALVNGEVRQDGNTADMIYPVSELVSFISHVLTLLPGDVILTGTPEGVGPIEAGDRVEIDIEGIGTLSNPVVRR